MNRMVLLGCVWAVIAVAAEPKQGHPLITPYEGSTLAEQESHEFDELTLPIGKENDGTAKTIKVEGKSTYLRYRTPKGRSELEIIKNYEQALKAGGFQVLYACEANQCVQMCQIPGIGCAQGARFLVAKLARPGKGEVFVAVRTTDYETWINITEARAMDTGMVKVDASAMGKGIDASGHVAVYGIVFDTGKSALKPESEEQLREISALLKDRPTLKIHVVGHTDNVGDLNKNMDLSKRRAQAVVDALTSKHGVAKARLNAAGVGSLVPIESNDTEAGRARNRRVDLVKQ